jgi:hypothetical protein
VSHESVKREPGRLGLSRRIRRGQNQSDPWNLKNATRQKHCRASSVNSIGSEREASYDLRAMPEEKTACLIKNGAVITVESPSPDVRRILEAVLFYQCVVRDAGRPGTYNRGATKYKSVPIEFYKYVHDPDKLFPPRMMMLAGYIPRIAAALKKHGYRITKRDVHPPNVRQPIRRIFNHPLTHEADANFLKEDQRVEFHDE